MAERKVEMRKNLQVVAYLRGEWWFLTREVCQRVMISVVEFIEPGCKWKI